MSVADLLNKINVIIMATEDTKTEYPEKKKQFELIEAIAYKEIKSSFDEFKTSLDQDESTL